MKHQIDWSKPPKAESPPNFDDLLTVLKHQTPSRPTLFEFGFNGRLREKLLGEDKLSDRSYDLAGHIESIYAWRNAGYDYFPRQSRGSRRY